jgi:hypothetical protein
MFEQRQQTRQDEFLQPPVQLDLLRPEPVLQSQDHFDHDAGNPPEGTQTFSPRTAASFPKAKFLASCWAFVVAGMNGTIFQASDFHFDLLAHHTVMRRYLFIFRSRL